MADTSVVCVPGLSLYTRVLGPDMREMSLREIGEALARRGKILFLNDPDFAATEGAADAQSFFYMRAALRSPHKQTWVARELGLFCRRLKTASSASFDLAFTELTAGARVLSSADDCVEAGQVRRKLAREGILAKNTPALAFVWDGEEETGSAARVKRVTREQSQFSVYVLPGARAPMTRREAADYMISTARALLVKGADEAVVSDAPEDPRVADIFARVRAYMDRKMPRVDKPLTGLQLTSQTIHVASRRLFPLCMQTIFDRLVEKGHLANTPRLVLRSFLVAVGLSYGDALGVWEKAAVAFVASDGAKRAAASEAKAGISYAYGKSASGKKANPFGCFSLIKSSEQADGGCSRCPFASLSDADLRATLAKKRGLAPLEAEKVVSARRGMHCQVACQALFDVTFAAKPGSAPDASRSPQNFYARALEW